MKKTPCIISLFLVWPWLSSCFFFSGINSEEVITLHLRPAWESEAVFENPASVVFDPVARILIVANVNALPRQKEGRGYLSKVALNGRVLHRHWLTGLNAPTGMAVQDDTLYVADMTDLAVIDLTSGRMQKYPAQDARFLKDVAIDSQGRVYVSDMQTDTLYLFAQDQLTVWLRDEDLASPTALFVEGNTLYVGSRGCATEAAGSLLKIDLQSREIRAVGTGSLGMRIDGAQGLASGDFLVTDALQGSLIHLSGEGEIMETLALAPGAADLAVLPEDWELVVVPMMQDNVLKAFVLPLP